MLLVENDVTNLNIKVRILRFWSITVTDLRSNQLHFRNVLETGLFAVAMTTQTTTRYLGMNDWFLLVVCVNRFITLRGGWRDEGGDDPFWLDQSEELRRLWISSQSKLSVSWRHILRLYHCRLWFFDWQTYQRPEADRPEVLVPDLQHAVQSRHLIGHKGGENEVDWTKTLG